MKFIYFWGEVGESYMINSVVVFLSTNPQPTRLLKELIASKQVRCSKTRKHGREVLVVEFPRQTWFRITEEGGLIFSLGSLAHQVGFTKRSVVQILDPKNRKQLS